MSEKLICLDCQWYQEVDYNYFRCTSYCEYYTYQKLIDRKLKECPFFKLKEKTNEQD